MRNSVNAPPNTVVASPAAIDASLPVALATMVSPSSTETLHMSDEDTTSVYMAVTTAELYDDNDLNIADTAVPTVAVNTSSLV